MTYTQQKAAFEAIKSLYRNEPQDIKISLSAIANQFARLAPLADENQPKNSMSKPLAEYFFFDCANYLISCSKQSVDTTFDTLETYLIKKGNDYANKNRLSNFQRTANMLNQTQERSCLTIIATKIARAENLIETGKTPENESLNDTLIDLACYAFLLYCIIIDKP